MAKPSRILLVVAAAFLSLISIGHAQLLTADTIVGGYNSFNSSINGASLSDGTALTQSFTMPASGVDSIDTLIFRFISPTIGAAGTSLDVYFSEWSGSDATSSLGFGTMTIPVVASWVVSDGGFSYYDAAIDLTAVASSLTALNTYALTIIGNADSAAGNYFLGGATNASYTDGSAFSHSSVTSFNNLMTGGTPHAGANDFAFIANSAGSPDALTPIPEASTIAVLFAGVFVGGLVIMRVRQRRQQVAAVA